MCPIWFLNVGVKLFPFIMLNVEIEYTKINILSSQLLIFPCVNMDYMLVLYNGNFDDTCLLLSFFFLLLLFFSCLTGCSLKIKFNIVAKLIKYKMIKKHKRNMSNQIFIVDSCRYLMNSFNCNVCYHSLCKFKYCGNALVKLSCLLFKNDDIGYNS